MKFYQERSKFAALFGSIHRLPSRNGSDVVESGRTFDAGDEIDRFLCPTECFHRIGDSFQILHRMDLRQYQRPNRGNGELNVGIMYSIIIPRCTERSSLTMLTMSRSKKGVRVLFMRTAMQEERRRSSSVDFCTDDQLVTIGFVKEPCRQELLQPLSRIVLVLL
jgi:hypothetical protein